MTGTVTPTGTVIIDTNRARNLKIRKALPAFRFQDSSLLGCDDIFYFYPLHLAVPTHKAFHNCTHLYIILHLSPSALNYLSTDTVSIKHSTNQKQRNGSSCHHLNHRQVLLKCLSQQFKKLKHKQTGHHTQTVPRQNQNQGSMDFHNAINHEVNK